MPSLSLRRPGSRRLALPAAALAVSLVPLTAAPAVAADAPTTAAADWLAAQLTDAGTVEGSYPDENGDPVVYTDWGRTLDAALGLLAAGTEPNELGRALYSATQPAAVAGYTQEMRQDGATGAYVGATAKLAFVVELTGGNAANVAQVDLLEQLRSLAQESGRFADRSDFGDYANVLGHAFALLAFDVANQPLPDNTVDALVAVQCADGGFPVYYEPVAPETTCASSPDATGLVLQALAAVDDPATDDDVAEAVAWLEAAQLDTGAWPGEAPVNSTGYALLGLLAAAPTSDAVAEGIAYLHAAQNEDGGLGTDVPGTESDVFATAQALPALAGTTFVASAHDVVHRPPLASIDPLCAEAGDSAFTDVNGNAHEAAIECIAALGVTEGVAAEQYAPAARVTRAQMASFVARSLEVAGVQLPDGAQQQFSDVPAGSPHAENINALAQLGVVEGYADGTYRPHVVVNRAQMATFLARAYEEAAGQPLPVGEPHFTDVEGTHAAAIARIADAGITVGVSATRYAPELPVQRDAMASFLARTLNLLYVAAGAPTETTSA